MTLGLKFSAGFPLVPWPGFLMGAFVNNRIDERAPCNRPHFSGYTFWLYGPFGLG